MEHNEGRSSFPLWPLFTLKGSETTFGGSELSSTTGNQGRAGKVLNCPSWSINLTIFTGPRRGNKLADIYVFPRSAGHGQGWQYGTVRYEMFWAKSTVRNYGTIYFPRYGTVRFESTIFFSNLFRTNLIIERRPLRYVRNQDLYRFRHVSMTYTKLYHILYIVQKNKTRSTPIPGLSFKYTERPTAGLPGGPIAKTLDCIIWGCS